MSKVSNFATVVTCAGLLSSLCSLLRRLALLTLSTPVPKALSFLILPSAFASITLWFSLLLAFGLSFTLLSLAFPTFLPLLDVVHFHRHGFIHRHPGGKAEGV